MEFGFTIRLIYLRFSLNQLISDIETAIRQSFDTEEKSEVKHGRSRLIHEIDNE